MTVTSAMPLQLLILLVGSWIGRRQGEAIEYLRAENRVLRARIGHKRLRFTDAERRLLVERGKPLGRKLLAEMASLATPETTLQWYRERVAAKYDGNCTRGTPVRPACRDEKLMRAGPRDSRVTVVQPADARKCDDSAPALGLDGANPRCVAVERHMRSVLVVNVTFDGKAPQVLVCDHDAKFGAKFARVFSPPSRHESYVPRSMRPT